MNNLGKDPLENIGYISIGEDIREKIGEFTIDPDIMLPIEFPPGQEKISTENITWEAIISAMLRILAYKPEHENADYFREFILAVKPDIKNELTEAGILKARNKDFDIAIEIFMALEGLFPDSSLPKLNLALTYEDRAYQYEKLEKIELSDKYMELAFSTYKRALNIDPENPQIHYNLAHFYLRQNSFEKAREYLKTFLEYSDDYRKKKEAQKIIKEINETGLMDKLFKEAFDYIKMGKEEEGIKKIRKFLDKHSDVWNAWFLLGWGYRRLGMYKEGKDAFQKALQLHTPLPDTLNELAICLMELGDFDESFKKLSDALKLEPDNTKVISNMGILSLKMGNEDEAKKYFRTVLEIDKNDSVAKEYLKKIHT
ncbi:MAG: hypothetical protein DRP57_01200 [Spirochaetes bacterium]|nr:MAG: hypothetical protein DRP57_01200 [Spirochaetota bacterium]